MDEPEKTVDKVVEEKTISADDISAYKSKGWKVIARKDKSGNMINVAQRIEQQKIPKKTHWEYDPGWRDGDFSYKFDGNTYTD